MIYLPVAMSMSAMLSDSTTSLIFISKQRRSIILEIVLVHQPDHHLEVKLNLTELSVVDVVNYLLHGLLIHLFHVNLVDVGHNGCSENRRVGTEKVLVDVEDLLVVLLSQEIFRSVVVTSFMIFMIWGGQIAEAL